VNLNEKAFLAYSLRSFPAFVALKSDKFLLEVGSKRSIEESQLELELWQAA